MQAVIQTVIIATIVETPFWSVSLLGIFARRRAGRIKFQTSSILLKFHPIMSPAIHAHFLLKQSNHEISALVEIGYEWPPAGY